MTVPFITELVFVTFSNPLYFWQLKWDFIQVSYYIQNRCKVKILRSLKRSLFAAQKPFFDHSKVRFTANPKLALWAQTLDLRPFRFTKNGYRKNLNSRSELPFPVFQRSQLVPFFSCKKHLLWPAPTSSLYPPNSTQVSTNALDFTR